MFGAVRVVACSEGFERIPQALPERQAAGTARPVSAGPSINEHASIYRGLGCSHSIHICWFFCRWVKGDTCAMIIRLESDVPVLLLNIHQN